MIQIAFTAFTQGLDLCNQPHRELSRTLLGILFAVQTYPLSSRTLNRYCHTRCGGIEGMLLRPLAGFSRCLFTLMFLAAFISSSSFLALALNSLASIHNLDLYSM